jgi:hypothetical protein
MAQDRYSLISVGEILYLFVGYASSRGLVAGAWNRARTLRRDRVYLRTSQDLFRTHYRSITAASGRLDPAQFIRIHQSILVNLNRVTEIDLTGKVKLLGVGVSNGTSEWLVVSRRSLPALRLELGLSPPSGEGSR